MKPEQPQREEQRERSCARSKAGLLAPFLTLSLASADELPVSPFLFASLPQEPRVTESLDQFYPPDRDQKILDRFLGNLFDSLAQIRQNCTEAQNPSREIKRFQYVGEQFVLERFQVFVSPESPFETDYTDSEQDAHEAEEGESAEEDAFSTVINDPYDDRAYAWGYTAVLVRLKDLERFRNLRDCELPYRATPPESIPHITFDISYDPDYESIKGNVAWGISIFRPGEEKQKPVTFDQKEAKILTRTALIEFINALSFTGGIDRRIKLVDEREGK